ncbi:MAG TPA: hypothetical protein VLB80_03745 [Candidatus Babeliales bacterium]|nr:hypothetical protein [Candidatus Babeliales bacterium]
MNVKNISLLLLLFGLSLANCESSLSNEAFQAIEEIPLLKELQGAKKKLKILQRKLPFYEIECQQHPNATGKLPILGTVTYNSKECTLLSALLANILDLELKVKYLEIDWKASDEYLDSLNDEQKTT